jgi:hypothetical protein
VRAPPTIMAAANVQRASTLVRIMRSLTLTAALISMLVLLMDA